MKKTFLSLFAFSVSLFTHAQYFQGDKLPDLVLGKELYQNNRSHRLSEFRQPLILLDIMSIHCSACIQALPHYDSLQALAKSEAKFLILVKDDKQKAESFFIKKGLNKFENLLFIAMSEEAKQSFNIIVNPMHIWVRHDKTIKAITGKEYINLENIRTQAKDEALPDWDDISLQPVEPLIDTTGIQNKSKLTALYTLFQGYRQGLKTSSSLRVDTAGNLQQWNLVNFSIRSLYNQAIKGLSTENLEGLRFIVQVSDSSRIFFEQYKGYRAAWKRQNYFSLQYILPLHTTAFRRHQKLLNDLNFYLGLNGKIEKRKMPCWVIKKDSTLPVLDQEKIIMTGGLEKGQMKIGEMIDLLNYKASLGIFILDENIDPLLNIHNARPLPVTLDKLKELMKSGHLVLEPQVRQLEVFVLADN